MHQCKMVDLATFRLIHRPNHSDDVCYILRFPSNRLINGNFHLSVVDMGILTNLAIISQICQVTAGLQITIGEAPVTSGQTFCSEKARFWLVKF